MLDVGDVPDCHCNDVLEGLFKALAESPDGDERSIWTPVENPWIALHVEDVTRRLQDALERIQDAIALLLTGEPIGTLSKADTPWLRWDPDRFDQVRAMLEAKAPASYTLEDWLLVADYLIQRYLPDGVISNEAEFLAVRATILGRLQAASASAPPPADGPSWSDLLPTHFAAVPERILSTREWEVLAVAKARAAMFIGNVVEATRARMKALVIEHVQAQVLGQKEGTPGYLKTRLFDEFGQLNRDMRRIAVTEVGEVCNQAFISAQRIGSKVIRREAYRGACKFCKSINGKTFTVVSPDAPTKNGATEVWLGKTNVGRSASPNMRVGGTLWERPAEKRWWPAAGLQHPHCRGAWLAVPDAPPGVSPDFVAYMDKLLAGHKAATDPPGYTLPG